MPSAADWSCGQTGVRSSSWVDFFIRPDFAPTIHAFVFWCAEMLFVLEINATAIGASTIGIIIPSIVDVVQHLHSSCVTAPKVVILLQNVILHIVIYCSER